MLKIFRSDPFLNRTDLGWFPYEATWSSKLQLEMSSHLVSGLNQLYHDYQREWQELALGIRPGTNFGTNTVNLISSVLKDCAKVTLPTFEVELIPGIREVRADATELPPEKWTFGGHGLIDRLAQLQNPGYNEQHLKTLFERINTFLAFVTGNEAARLEIPAKRDTINVHMDGRALPLASLGTGIHEVVILAAAATILKQHVVCIEEPEIHLHPVLQRKLVKYLDENTDNQYFIATYSAHLLNHPGAAVFNTRLINGVTEVRTVEDDRTRSEVCVDLGYRASDLVQANSIIWVEGPSDRVYLNHWIRSIEPDFIEGIHYSIMFYGGRLLAHLSADDPEVEEFISLRRLNRSISIVMDSDRKAPRRHLNKTKLRVRTEFEKGPGFAWVTGGREIENYIPEDVWSEAIRLVHGGKVPRGLHEVYGKRSTFKKANGDERPIDKIKVARQVVELDPGLDVLDLKRMVQKLVSFIDDAN